jgi:hypothetical protein
MRKNILLLCLAACAPQTGSQRQELALTDSGGPVTLSSGNNNNWSSDLCGQGAGVCRVVGDASGSTITGLSASYYGDRDVGLRIWNEGTTPIVIANQSTSSTLGNRLHLRGGADVVLGAGSGILLATLVDWTTDPYTPIGWYEMPQHGLDSPLTSTPSRTLGTAFRPSTSRHTLVTYSASVDCTITVSGGQEGRVELLSDSANPPTTVRGELAGCKNTGTVVLGVSQVMGDRGTASYLVPIGDYALIRSVTVTGTPSFAITHQTEQAL